MLYFYAEKCPRIAIEIMPRRSFTVAFAPRHCYLSTNIIKIRPMKAADVSMKPLLSLKVINLMPLIILADMLILFTVQDAMAWCFKCLFTHYRLLESEMAELYHYSMAFSSWSDSNVSILRRDGYTAKALFSYLPGNDAIRYDDNLRPYDSTTFSENFQYHIVTQNFDDKLTDDQGLKYLNAPAKPLKTLTTQNSGRAGHNKISLRPGMALILNRVLMHSSHH